MCLGDADGDDRVTVDEAVQVVNNILGVCSEETSTDRRVIQTYAENLFNNYRDAERLAESLREAVDEFVANPSAVLLDSARAAWLAARPTYLQTEMARFYEGPIDNAETGPEGRINAWPLDEGYIDYVAGNANSGIINDPAGFPSLTKQAIADLNEIGGESNISTGYHAIEFLLWGQDQSADRNGNRPYTDYVTGAGGTAANQARRGQYLRAVAELLVDDLRSVREQWDPRISGNYRAEFLALDTKVALGRIFTGLGTLSGFELSEERMSVALETQDQEDEHSCFSDNTHVDHRNDQQGIENAYLGDYGSHAGPGLDELVRAVDPSLDDRMKAQLALVKQRIRAIPVPFDRSILGADSAPARQAIILSVEALRDQTGIIEEIAEKLGIDITTS